MRKLTKTVYTDTLHILACRISVWAPETPGTIELEPPEADKCLVITECESIEIEDSWKKLINTAVVKLPRGTMISGKAVLGDQNPDNPDTSHSVVDVTRLENGAILERRPGGQAAAPSMFYAGQRIQIKLGYYTDMDIAGDTLAERKRSTKLAIAKALDHAPDFDGYIVKCSTSTPIELRCENLAYALKRKNCANIPTAREMTVKELLGEDGTYKLLEGTGLRLHPHTSRCDISIGRITMSKDWTVADLLTNWEESKLYSFILNDDDGNPCLAVGRSYFSAKSTESILNYKDHPAKIIQFDYHVAQDHLTLMNTDKMFLAVEAQCRTKDNKFYHLAIRLNPEWNTDHTKEKFQVINKTNLSAKSMKLIGVIKKNVNEKVDLSQYNVIPYMSAKIGLTEAELVEEAKAYFESYNMNGIEGNLVIFGDLRLTSGEKVGLLDEREPEKNGWYLLDEVHTSFGVNGYRQKLVMPYCIAREGKTEK